VAGFTGSSSKTTVTVQGMLGTGILFALPSPITVGKPVPLAAGLLLPSTAYPAGGTIAFAVNGTTVGSCVPQPGALKNSAGCGITAPPPTSPGAYSVTATFSQSPSFAGVSRTVAGTATAAPAPAPAPAVKKSTAVSSPTTATGPSTATPTPLPTESASQRATPTSSPVPVALADGTTTVARSSASPWPLVLVAGLGLILGAGIAALVVVLLRRSSQATPTG
jgi:hypothetical protein